MSSKLLKQKLLASQVCIFLIILASVSPCKAQTRKPRPGKKYVWVNAHVTKNGQKIPGHWRKSSRKGYIWVSGKNNLQGVYVAAHWKPVGPAPKGKTWVTGYANDKSEWIAGYYRQSKKTDFIWVAGHYGPNNRWIKGRWKRLK